LPFHELGRVENIVEAVDGWPDNETFVVRQEVEVRKSDGTPRDSLSEGEQAVLDADEFLVAYRSETVRLRRPDLPQLD
jgi:hypothetical protein